MVIWKNDMNAFEKGRLMFKMGKNVCCNPYPVGSMNNSNWRTGWRTAEAFQLEKNKGNIKPSEGVILR